MSLAPLTQAEPSSGEAPESRLESRDSIDRDEMYTLLSSRRRRNVLHALAAFGGRSTLSELARQLAAWETGKPPEAVTSTERKRTYTALRQTHLGKLAAHGVVAYDADRGTVELTDSGRGLRPYLWPRQQLGGAYVWSAVVVVAVATVASALSWAGVGPFALLTGYQLAAVVTAAFGLVTMVTLRLSRPGLLDRIAQSSDTEYGRGGEGVPADD